MSKCDAYYTIDRLSRIGNPYKEGHCSASKWEVECHCDGNTDNCTFYPEKRKQTMNTAEMWLKAQEDGKTYRSGDVYYDKDIGFLNSTNNPSVLDDFDSYEEFMILDDWEAVPEIPTITRAEAETKLGVKIID